MIIYFSFPRHIHVFIHIWLILLYLHAFNSIISVIDSFLDDPTEVPVSFSKKSINDDVGHSVDLMIKRPKDDNKERSRDTMDYKSVDEGQRDLIKENFVEKEAQLLNDFKAKHDARKRALEERLRKKRESKPWRILFPTPAG